MSPLENVNRLYSTYTSMGLDKSTIVRKLKAQFTSAKFVFKGSALYVSFGGNAEQKVTGGVVELNASTRLAASGFRTPDNDKLEKILHAIKAAGFKKVINIAQEGAGASDELIIQTGAPVTGHQLVQFAKALNADVDHITIHPGNHSIDLRISSFMVK